MSYPVIGSDYHRSMRVPRSAREAFGSDMEREQRWQATWDQVVVGLCVAIAAALIPAVWCGWL